MPVVVVVVMVFCLCALKIFASLKRAQTAPMHSSASYPPPDSSAIPPSIDSMVSMKGLSLPALLFGEGPEVWRSFCRRRRRRRRR